LHSCIWELFFTWILVVLFCRWCQALLPHLEELAILEHFISVMSSRCPCLRGPRFFSLKWSFLGFCLAFDHLLEFFFCFFFLFSLNWLLVCVVNALIKGEIEDRRVRGTTWKTGFGNGRRSPLVTGNAPVTDQVLQISQER
jgi:hypothetical protein